MRNIIEAGALARRPIRRYLLERGINFTEDKAFLDSVFYVDGSKEIINSITFDINRWKKETEK